MRSLNEVEVDIARETLAIADARQAQGRAHVEYERLRAAVAAGDSGVSHTDLAEARARLDHAQIGLDARQPALTALVEEKHAVEHAVLVAEIAERVPELDAEVGAALRGLEMAFALFEQAVIAQRGYVGEMTAQLRNGGGGVQIQGGHGGGVVRVGGVSTRPWRLRAAVQAIVAPTMRALEAGEPLSYGMGRHRPGNHRGDDGRDRRPVVKRSTPTKYSRAISLAAHSDPAGRPLPAGHRRSMTDAEVARVKEAVDKGTFTESAPLPVAGAIAESAPIGLSAERLGEMLAIATGRAVAGVTGGQPMSSKPIAEMSDAELVAATNVGRRAATRTPTVTESTSTAGLTAVEMFALRRQAERRLEHRGAEITTESLAAEMSQTLAEARHILAINRRIAGSNIAESDTSANADSASDEPSMRFDAFSAEFGRVMAVHREPSPMVTPAAGTFTTPTTAELEGLDHDQFGAAFALAMAPRRPA